jgi:DNA repair protein RecN (Recombination protein N)
MLTELKVSQFAIIDHIHIHFNHGLNILSGETGAGKSILIKSLALLMGAKSSQQDIRNNKEMATIEGAFDLAGRIDIKEKLLEIGIGSEENTLIVRRLIHNSGKSKVYLNGHLSSVSDLRDIVFPLVTLSNPSDAPLIEITSQHENKDLTSSRYQMDTLDQFCGNIQLRSQVELNYNEVRELNKQRMELESLSQQREQQIDFLDFQIKEIESIGIGENEDQELLQKIKNIKQKSQWQSWIQDSEERLNGSDRSILSQLKKILTTAPDHSSLKQIKDQIDQAHQSLEDVAYSLQQMSSNDLDSDENLEDLEERLNRIRKLQKKFGSEVKDILLALQDMKTEHHKLTHLSETLSQLKGLEDKAKKELSQSAKKLHDKRNSGATLLSQEVNNELKDLNMKGLEFLIDLEELEEAQSTGIDRVVFRVRTGKKDVARDLAKVASGGELSRILLSLKQVVGANQFPRTFLFDEVDTGVSGPTAEKVGAKLKNLAKHQQVICVTHLPQVASFGDHHYYIEKQPNSDTVEMTVTLLNKKERIDEIARLISGEKVTKTSIAHAKELLSHSL